ncbi:hypothetical protein KCV03_g418, partial [Aureobasidium melanogenum]
MGSGMIRRFGRPDMQESKCMADAKKKACCVQSSSSSDELGMGASHDSDTALTVLDFEDVDLGKGQRTTNLVGNTLDLNLITFLCGALIGDMNINAHTSLLPQIVRSDGHAAHPVYNVSSFYSSSAHQINASQQHFAKT